MYQRHPCPTLNAMFSQRPYQGANPETSKFVFIGLDANYQANLEDSPSYHDTLAYHADGVMFWQKLEYTTPFCCRTIMVMEGVTTSIFHALALVASMPNRFPLSSYCMYRQPVAASSRRLTSITATFNT
jgi:hypothetical protein